QHAMRMQYISDLGDILITGKPPFRMATFDKDRVIGLLIRLYGHFQEDAVLDVIKFVGLDPRRKTFLDIGANIGTHGIYALGQGFDKAICIEPDPGNFMLLKINQILNGLDGRCTNINAAVSSGATELQFELSETNFGDHRIRLDAGSDNTQYAEQNRKVISVKAQTLDAIMASHSIDASQIGLAWIDTQGHEGHVFSGASKLIAANVPIVMEFWPYGLNRSGGYPMLREYLSRQTRIYDIRKPLEGQPSLSIAEIDAMFESWIKRETGTNAEHTDFLVMPN
ncbi:MAG: FkbM family methyltransferase, partial [Rhizobiaceae bacterium]